MFTAEERAALRSQLLKMSADDNRIEAAAITGSAAAGREDQWSDIDLAFAVTEPSELQNVLSDWTAHMYRENAAVHHIDLKFEIWTYRVFLLSSTLQVDLAYVPAKEFRALAASFQLVFGTAREPNHAAPPQPEHIVGLGWLFALHARSCLARRRFWQAEYMISGVRDTALTLACLRHGLATAHGRGFDELPTELTAPFEAALVRGLTESELRRAFKVSIDRLLDETRYIDHGLHARVQEPLVSMCESNG